MSEAHSARPSDSYPQEPVVRFSSLDRTRLHLHRTVHPSRRCRIVRFAGVCALAVIISVAVLGQKADTPKWAGTWELDVQKSSFGKILFRGAPVDFTLLSQRAKLEQGERCTNHRSDVSLPSRHSRSLPYLPLIG